MKKLVLACAALSALTTVASAADLLIIDEPGAMAYTDAGFDWSGFYAGLTGGYGAGQSRAVGSVNGLTDLTNLSGGLLGGTVGVNSQFDSFVLGLEGDVVWSGLAGGTACNGAPALSCNGNVDWMGTVKGRAGYAVDQVLFFVSGGLAAGGIRATVTPAVGGTTGSHNFTSIGWTVGGGVEVAVTDNISVKAEYSYLDLGSGTAPVGTLGAVNSYAISTHVHAAKVGVNFHF